MHTQATWVRLLEERGNRLCGEEGAAFLYHEREEGVQSAERVDSLFRVFGKKEERIPHYYHGLEQLAAGRYKHGGKEKQLSNRMAPTLMWLWTSPDAFEKQRGSPGYG